MIEIIPAIDILDGRCVRLTKGDYAQKRVYYPNPADAAKMFRDAGLRRLHMVDLDGARAAAPANLAVLEKVASQTGMEIQYGGGIRSQDGLRSVLDAGASRAICGSVAVSEPEEFEHWLSVFAPSRIILGADVRSGLVATHGWLRGSELTAAELIGRFLPGGLCQVICTDISKDGMLGGPSFSLYEELMAAFGEVEFTASGGVSSTGDIAILEKAGIRSAIVGKALYEGRITLREISQYVAARPG